MQSRPSIPTYPSARTVASLLRLIGLVYLALAALPLLLTFAGFRVEVIEGLALAVAALFAMLLVWTLSEVISMIRDTAINSFRTAEAVERMTPATTPAANPRQAPPPATEPEVPRSMAVEQPKPADGRAVICNMCGAKLKLPADGHIKAGNRAKCPKCGALVAT